MGASFFRSVSPTAAFAVVLALGVFVTTVFAVATTHVAVPFWDQWQSAYPELTLEGFFAQHNEHRIMIPRLFFVVDQYVFSGTDVFNRFSILLIQLCHAGLLYILFSAVAPQASVKTKLITAAGLLAATTSLIQWENFVWGFQVQFVLVYAAATASIVALLSFKKSIESNNLCDKYKSFIALSTANFIATFSMANGILVGGVLIITALLIRIPRRYIAILIAQSVILAILYFWNHVSQTVDSDPLNYLNQLPTLVLYVIRYIGNPIMVLLHVSTSQRLLIAGLFGTVGIGLFLVISVIALYKQRDSNDALVALLALATFCLGTAGVTALGRIVFPPEQALSPRYLTPSIIFWVVVCAASWALASNHLKIRKVLGAFTILMVTALFYSQFTVYYTRILPREQSHDRAALSLIAGVFDRSALRAIHWSPQGAFDASIDLKRQRLSLFSKSWALQLGDSFHDHYHEVSASRCVGYFDKAKVLRSDRGGWRVSGWAWNVNSQRPVERVILITSSDRIGGFALGGFPRPDVQSAERSVNSRRTGWLGYTSVVAPGEMISAYAILDKTGSACKITGEHPVTIGSFLRKDIDSALPARSLEVAVTGVFRRGGYYPDIVTPDWVGPAYGSWVGSDENTGKISLQAALSPNQNSLVLPIVTGPSIRGQRIIVRDPSGIPIYAQLDFDEPVLSWTNWLIPLPKDPPTMLEIVAEDNGTAWGQWIGVGTPSFLSTAPPPPSKEVN